MAWTNPTSRSTGELITPTIWNTDLVDNLIALKDPPSDDYELNEGADYTTSSTTFVDVDATNLAMSLNTNGGDVLVHFHGVVHTPTTASNLVQLRIDINGLAVGADNGILTLASGVLYEAFSFTRLLTDLSAGAKTIKLQWRVTGGSATLFAGAGTSNYDIHPQMWAREVS